MSKIQCMTSKIREALNAQMDAFEGLTPEEQLVQGPERQEELKQIVAEIAGLRRAAVRQLRATGYTLKEIGNMLGTTAQRVHQIESGYSRHEAAARKLRQ